MTCPGDDFLLPRVKVTPISSVVIVLSFVFSERR